MPFRILLVDDFQPFRKLTRSILQRDSRLRIVGEASDGLEAVQKARELRPDLILLDIGLPKLNGIEAARRILRSAPQSKIIFVSQESSALIVQEALALGARGYVVKTQASKVLIATVDGVLQEQGFTISALADEDVSAEPARAPSEPISTT